MPEWISNYPEMTGVVFALVMILVLGAAIPIGERIFRLKKKEQPKPKRHRTHGREFLLLLDKETWVELRQIADFRSNLFSFLLATAAGVLFCLSALIDHWLSSLSSLLFMGLAVRDALNMRRVLLPIYCQRRRDKAQAERDVVTQRIEAKLPQARYRVSGSTITSIEQFRSMANEDRLPEELVPDAKDLERADLELEEAEADLPAQPQTKAQTT
ncbi:MAG: hypothetical protein ACYC44_02600 [Patescibacteria group bacterium]